MRVISVTVMHLNVSDLKLNVNQKILLLNNGTNISLHKIWKKKIIIHYIGILMQVNSILPLTQRVSILRTQHNVI